MNGYTGQFPFKTGCLETAGCCVACSIAAVQHSRHPPLRICSLLHRSKFFPLFRSRFSSYCEF